MTLLKWEDGSIDWRRVKHFEPPPTRRNTLNKDNSLGTGGELALEFATLLRQMWSDSGSGLDSVTDPTCFKDSLGSFAPRFRGNDQHDSQELCIYLLDILHEDTNRVREKPPNAKTPEQEEGESDEGFANEVRNYDFDRSSTRVAFIRCNFVTYGLYHHVWGNGAAWRK